MSTRPRNTNVIMTLFRRWEDVETDLSCPNVDDNEIERLTAAGNDLEDAILALPARTVADFAAKVLVHTLYGQFTLDGDPAGERLIEEAIALARSSRSTRKSAPPANLLDAVRAARAKL
ncbi:hypothetical protein [Mesorhizobium sp. 1B3]|uniref:hypothetical protein n=1 Tax=Mesorhizobium sp. 1B3 TaxID=3243599 RepID=UPI003D962C61